MQRRHFLQVGAAGMGSLLLPIDAWSSALQPKEDPHFLLQLYVQDGVDSLFLFDGRSKAMTEAGFIHDHLKEEPEPWVGNNGVTCLATAFARRLAPHRQRFSVINGVFMATAFDGHPQNINFLFTGNPFGGESFVAHVNDRNQPGYQKRPLDALQNGVFPLDLTNGGATIPLSLDSAFNLVEFLKRARPIDARHAVMAFIASRMDGISGGRGRFSKGSAAMRAGYGHAPDLAERLKRLKLKPGKDHPDLETGFVDLMAGFFREGICSSAVMRVGPKHHHLDVHGGGPAKLQTEMYDSVSEKLLRLFNLLATTPFDNHRSLFDVTTVMVASEFGRTLRQPNLALDETGTDHNSLNNSILLGGKGIRGGMVIGETDWRTPDEELSPVHHILDADGLKLIGKPFDFETGRAREDRPENYNLDDHLTIASVVNTVYSCFSVPQPYWRTVNRDGPKAPLLSHLLL